MSAEDRLKRLHFRAWHRGTREADYMMGGFFDRLHQGWDAESLDWFEALLGQEDPDVMGWVMGTIPVPPEWQGPMMERMQRIDYVHIPR
ncbi:MAG: succinate dehydrogenase assembly factor 2 [Sphingomonadales bacterium]|nr:MAG: succinate dehydrogenase assembly factor 2 [Sphingomonadales bacterium]